MGDEARHFYVTMKRGARAALLAGPFSSHQEALDLVEAARDAAYNVDPWVWFDLFGTASLISDHPPVGALNSWLGLEARHG